MHQLELIVSLHQKHVYSLRRAHGNTLRHAFSCRGIASRQYPLFASASRWSQKRYILTAAAFPGGNGNPRQLQNPHSR